jgi:hypothetical protein
MLVCTLVLAGRGYHWRDTPTPRAAICLGAVMGLGALSTTYVIPAALGHGCQSRLAGKKWIAWDRTHFKLAWSFPIGLATSLIVVIAFWSPGVFKQVFSKPKRKSLARKKATAIIAETAQNIPDSTLDRRYLDHLFQQFDALGVVRNAAAEIRVHENWRCPDPPFAPAPVYPKDCQPPVHAAGTANAPCRGRALGSGIGI